MRLPLLLLCLSAQLCWTVPNPVAEKMLADLPVTFERNQGQWPRHVEFGAHIGGHLYAVMKKEIVIDGTVHLDLISSSRGKLEALDPVNTKTNYLNSADPRKWITRVPNFTRIRRRHAFPGIDLILYGSHGQLEFDYLVSPGARPDIIHLRVRGASVQSVTGNLKLTTPAGQVLNLRAPAAYQETRTGRQAVDCQFQVNNRGEVAFTTLPYDQSLPLLIDPVLTFLSIAPGTRDSGLGSISTPTAAGPDGSFYLTGETMTPIIPTTSGTLRPTSSCPAAFTFPGCTDSWVMKLNPNSNQVAWATYFTTTYPARILTMAVDISGNVVLGGSPGSPDFPVTPDAYLPELPAGANPNIGAGFLAKLNPTGSALVYSTFLERVPEVMKLDSHGDVYVSDGILFSSLTMSVPTVQKFTADGTRLLYSIQIPGGVRQITTDDSANLYVLSGPSSQFPVTPGAYSSTDKDALFILKFDPQSKPLFAASFNAPPPVNVYARSDIAVDPSGTIVFSGFGGVGLPVVNDPDPHVNDCDPDNPCMAYVAALDSTGSRLLYSRLLGHGEGQKVALDPNGDVYLAGQAEYPHFPRTFDAFHYCSNPGISNSNPSPVFTPNGFIMRLDPQGRRVFSSFLGTSGTTVTDLQLAANGKLYLGGYNTELITTTDGSCCQGYFVGVIDTNQTPRIPHACLVNATQNVGDAGGADLFVAPGQMVTLFGEGLGPQTSASADWNADGSLSNSLGGAQVLFDGIPAPMLYAQANQINCIVPFGVAQNQTTSAIVQYAGNQTDPLIFHVAGSVANPFTNGYYPGADVLAINEDGTFNSADHPATRGSIVTFFATGLGQTDPPLEDGQIAQAAAPATPGVKVSFFSKSSVVLAEVLYQGAAPGQVAGFYQLNVRIPATATTGHTQVQFHSSMILYSGTWVTEGIWLQ